MTAKMASACLPLILLIFCVIFVHVESQNCQEGWHFFNGSCYSFSGLQVMWAEALAICKAFNAKLAEIETSEENEFLKNLAREKSADSTFLGGTDIFEDGFWVWTSSGKHIYPFVDWAPNEPSNVAYTCLGFWGVHNYQWSNFYCDVKTNFICEATSTAGTIVG